MKFKNVINYCSSRREIIYSANCSICGEFYYSVRLHSVVCGKKCLNVYRRDGRLINCKQCFKFIYRPEWQYKKHSDHFCSINCLHKFNTKENSYNWIGDKFKKTNQYRRFNINKIPTMAHRHIMENHIGRKLKINEIVHHINKNIHDNKIENLMIMDKIQHTIMHCFKHGRYCQT